MTDLNLKCTIQTPLIASYAVGRMHYRAHRTLLLYAISKFRIHVTLFDTVINAQRKTDLTCRSTNHNIVPLSCRLA